MPFMQAIATRANAELTREKRRGKGSPFAEPGSLVAGLKELGIIAGPRESAQEEFLEAFPSGLKESVRAVLHDNLSRAEPLDVTVAWSPAYEDEVKIFQVADSDVSDGGITILVRSRYPGDRTAPGTGIK
jgi:hypothetical protein